MTEDIKMIKAKVIQFMDQEVNKYGNGRMDVKQVSELADIIKDLSEAEHFCAIVQSMTDNQDAMGYTQPRMTGQGGMGGQGSTGGRQGYGGGSMGHTDPMQAVREMLAIYPDLRSQLRSELM